MDQAPPGAVAASSQSGSQSIARAVGLLKAVAEGGADGARLSVLAKEAGLHLATARRILQALVGAGLLSFDGEAKRYFVGPAIFSLALKGNPWFSRRQAFMPALEKIARQTRDTVLFSIRSGTDSICLVRREGDFPIRVMTLDAGSIRPLGVGSGSLALLAFLPEEERQVILQSNADRYAGFGLSVEDVAAMADEALQAGFAFNRGTIINNVYGVAVPILTGEGEAAVAAVSVVAIAERMDETRVKEIVAIIRNCLAPLPGVCLAPMPSRKKRGGKLGRSN